MFGLFLGAGFSRWAAGLPVASELFDFNVRIRVNREERWLNSVADEWEQWSKENPDGLAEQFIAWALDLPAKRRKRIIWYIARRLSDPFLCRIIGGSATYSIDDRRVRAMPEVVRAQKFLQRFLGSSAGIVTCNYDLLVEYALSTRYFNYGISGEQIFGRGANPWFPGWGSNPRLRGLLPVAKIHGSLSWDSTKRYTDGRRGLSGEALIVPPRPEKTPPPELLEQWKLAQSILSQSDKLVVFGFAFNPYDTAVLELLKRSGENITQVLLIDIRPQRESASEIWPKATILCSQPPEDETFTLDCWFK